MSAQYPGLTWADNNGTYPVSATRLAQMDQGVRDAIAPPACRAYSSVAISVANAGSGSAVSFDTEEFDTDGMHDPAQNPTRLTAKHAGEYLVIGGAEWAAQATASGTRQLSIVKGGATTLKKTKLVLGTAFNAEVVPQGISVHVVLAINEYVELVAFQSSGAALSLSAPSASVEAPSLAMLCQGY